MIRLVDPTLRAVREDFEPAPRPATLDGARLGLLANGKTHGEFLLDAVVAELSRTYALGEVLRITKPHPSEPPTAAQWRQLAEHSTVVLSAIGDCGSCSSCSVVDGIRLEREGIPSAVLITEPFVPTVQAIAAMNGAPGYGFAVIPHPVTRLAPDLLRERAAQAAPALAALLLGAPALRSPGPTARSADEALAPLRSALAADGVTLTVQVEQGVVRLGLSTADDACATCVLPEPTIHALATRALTDHFGAPVAVELKP
ncbi:UGSC family (seleno)protein [Nonomuraea sediminis]|uniref:UGSC family (seleno)protein n=1 Tax=Nonomuraea sediminis TaxID=2835864 RepID=UPI001BDCC4A8|nr:UGSC family (seleno)protein [Nonomuraea sediminis]